jgi:uncharacterized protein YndB with AHSA1/START domain
MISTGTASVTLPTDDQILITREFDAPPALVWRTITEPDLVRRWWGAGMGEMTVCEIDLRVGGKWRYAQTAASSGDTVEFYGEYLELEEPTKVVNTEIFAPFPDSPTTCTCTLTPSADGTRTTLRNLVQHTTTESRDMHINSGMEVGLQKSFDALERTAADLVNSSTDQ